MPSVPRMMPAGREIRALDELMQVIQRRVGLAALRCFPPAADCIQDGVAYFREIVGRHVRRHADGDAGGAIDQQVGETRR